MEHNLLPNTSPMWCNASSVVNNVNVDNYDGTYWYWWRPAHNCIIWYNMPFETTTLDKDICYKIEGNIWVCPIPPEQGNLIPEPSPMPIVSANIKPSMTFTSVKMENHPEHISVMFGQVLSNLK